MTRWVAILTAALLPGTVCAQDAPQPWHGMATAELATVYVLDDAGVETRGKLLRLSEDSIVLPTRRAAQTSAAGGRG
ncbi:MAG: hypothetical protein AB1635_20525 [Acidobacteriota bacterium]